MAAQLLSAIDREMASYITDRLARIDAAISLLQCLRDETATLQAELFQEGA
jgi:hypothetical protein